MRILLIPLIFFYLKGHVAYRTVFTKSGPIRGKRTTIDNLQVYQYLKIPYAKPPVGNLRFQKPQPIPKWTETLDATAYGPSCIQSKKPIVMSLLVNKEFSEDCLHLNIYVPANTSTSPRAVMVWIHGGVYIYGQGTLFDSSILATIGDVIVVTINYRLGILGFLSHKELQGNYGIWDQIEALKWVKNNIFLFGGDEKRITVFGESAGAASIGILATIPEHTRGLFQRAIMQSGGYNNLFALAQVKEYQVNNFLSLIGCSDLTAFRDVTNCLREKSSTKILRVQEEWLEFYGYEGAKTLENFIDIVYIGPVIDHDLLQEKPQERLKNTSSHAYKYFRSLDVMCGVNSGEGSFLLEEVPAFKATLDQSINIDRGLPRSVLEKMAIPKVMAYLGSNSSVVATAINNLYGSDAPIKQAQKLTFYLADVAFNVPMKTTLELHSYGNSESKTFQYLFDERSPLSLTSDPPYWFTGAPHADELAFLFGAFRVYNLPGGRQQRKLSDDMIKYWSSFARSGDPNNWSSVPTKWLQYKSFQMYYLQLSAGNIKLGLDLFSDRIHFWHHTVPSILSSATENVTLHVPVDILKDVPTRSPVASRLSLRNLLFVITVIILLIMQRLSILRRCALAFVSLRKSVT